MEGHWLDVAVGGGELHDDHGGIERVEVGGEAGCYGDCGGKQCHRESMWLDYDTLCSRNFKLPNLRCKGDAWWSLAANSLKAEVDSWGKIKNWNTE